MRSRRPDSGAAMVIAIAIMTILLAIALTFFTVTRLEVQTATNVTNSVRSDQLTNGAINIAIAHLNQDFFRHPNATSTDHAWRTLFNGAWAVGKPWALRGGLPLQNGGVPYVDLHQLPLRAIQDAGIAQPLYVRFPDGYREMLYQGQRTKEWLYYPRVEMLDGRPVLYDPNTALEDRNGTPVPENLYFRYDGSLTAPDPGSNRRPPSYFPFVTSALYDIVRQSDGVQAAFALAPTSPEFDASQGGDGGYQYPAEQIHEWTDVDNDGDGLRDSMWIPIPADSFFPDDGVDNNLNGLIDELQDNGINEDEDFFGPQTPDGTYRLDCTNLPCQWVPNTTRDGNTMFDPDEAIEAGVFVYWGGNDGLDNDGNGLIDRADPNEFNPADPTVGYFLTAPLPGIEILVDFNADGVAGDLVPTENPGELVPLRVKLPDIITVTVVLDTDGDGVPDTPADIQLTAANVDRLDNDLDLTINDFYSYAYIGPNTEDGPPFRLAGFGSAAGNVFGMRDGSKVNSYLAAPGAQMVNPDGSTTAPPLTYYSAQWRLPGNWFTGLVPGEGAVKDEDLFADARSRAYVDINLQSVLRNAPLTVFPSSGVFTNPNTGTQQTINYQALAPYIRFTHSGEPVCELVGRAAIFINDEASKINLNAAGGHTFLEPDAGNVVNWVAPVGRALGQGLSPAEIETRNLPEIGVARSRKLWQLLTGAPGGQTNPALAEYRIQPPADMVLRYDAALPGYGRVDDNGNALLLAMNGLDDDGDGLIDEGLNPAYPELLGIFEGIDEPGEAQRFRPLRNEPAERDGIDNDQDGVTDEIGEMGDRQLQNIDQISALSDFGDPGTTRYENVRNLITAYSADRNANYVETDKGIRTINRLDFNHATPQQTAAALIISGGLRPVTDAGLISDPAARRFAEGLRQADTHFSAAPYEIPVNSGNWFGGFLHVRPDVTAPLEPATLRPEGHLFPADPQLQAMQLAVNVADYRDADYARSLLITERTDLRQVPGEVFWPAELAQRDRLAAGELMPLEEIEQYLKKTLGVDTQRVQSLDIWWADHVTDVYVDPADPSITTPTPQQRHISYATAGADAIRINELMVRAVRRVEAEATPGSGDNLDPTPYAGMPQFDVVAGIITPALVPGVGEDGWILSDLGGVPASPIPLGKDSFWMVNPTLSSHPSALNSALSAEVPNVIEFEFRANTGLPPGRYYLTVNVSHPDLVNLANPDPIPTVSRPSELFPDEFEMQYTIKYRNAAADEAAGVDNSILADIVRVAGYENDFNFTGYLNYYFQDLDKPDFIGRMPNGVPTGQVFLPGTMRRTIAPPAVLVDTAVGLIPEDTYWADGLRVESEPQSGQVTFAVTIPGPADPYDTLCVAIRMHPNHPDYDGIDDPLPGDQRRLAINSFDFSQEPDHEWVELVNVSDQVVDVSRWELEVGIPSVPNGPEDLFRSLWTVGDGVSIAPGGMLLLTFDSDGAGSKYDAYRELGGGGRNLINNNGIGVSAGGGDPDDPANATPGVPDIRNVTVPPIPGLYYISRPEAELSDPTGSVFERVFDAVFPDRYRDFVDRDGDGLSSAFVASPTPDTDRVAQESSVLSTPPLLGETPPTGVIWTGDGANRPWDRIAPLRNRQLWRADAGSKVSLADLNGVENVGLLAQFVLRGGVFPNNPEHDGYDNDGDGGYMVGTQYVPGMLDMDGVDNNLESLDGALLYGIDEQPAPDTDGVLSPFVSEGVDEGRHVGWAFGRRHGAGSFEAGILPVAFVGDYSVPPDEIADVAAGVRYLSSAIGDPGIAWLGDASVINNIEDAPYLGSDGDPPEWKAYAERRWYPGDNVIVTLYAGSSELGKVADRVTYRELDVTNRTVDDVAQCPYTNPGTGLPDTLHPDYATLWQPDQMGLDFYRSLERKHPLYAGDRFGTQNRWQATDGNYDDWAESVSVFEHTANLQNYPFRLTIGSDGLPQVFDLSSNPDPETLRLVGHALSGSPLRMNASQRLAENPPDLLKVTNTVAAAPGDRPLRQFSALQTLGSFENLDTAWALLAHPDQAFRSAGDLLSLPQVVLRQRMLNMVSAGAAPEYAYLFDPTRVNLGWWLRDTRYPSSEYWRQDIGFASAVLGQDTLSADMLSAAQDLMATNPMVLTVAQAEFTPIRPNPTETAVYTASDTLADLLNVDIGSGVYPKTWAPVFLFSFPGDSAPFPNYPRYADGSVAGQMTDRLFYLFDSNFLLLRGGRPFGADGLPPEAIEGRWPLARRTAMYWSAPDLGMPNIDRNRPEALFTWDADDGLENGEYMVYIGMAPANMPGLMAMANGAAEIAFSTSLLTDFGKTFGFPVDAAGRKVALEVITDPTKARGMARADALPGAPGLTHPDNWLRSSPENTGEEVGIYEPGADGIVFYGNNAAGGWRPKMVRVTDNFLALRVRNVGEDVAAITHVVLAPRKRIPGKINVNTAMNRVVRYKPPGQSVDYDHIFNPLLTVPGVVDALTSVRDYATPPVRMGGPIGPDEDIPLLRILAVGAGQPWPSPSVLTGGPDVPPSLSALDSPNLLGGAGQGDLAAFRLSALLMAGRPEHPDGRYYADLSELVRESSAVITTGVPYPLSNESDAARRQEEIYERFRRMANVLTVRSDVFEIIALVQAGYGVDQDGDGWINYRSNDEFVVTAESKGRVVYERRVPSDRADEPVE